MPKYKASFEKHWIEYGEVIIDSDDEDTAREVAEEMLLDGGDEIQWGAMDPQSEAVSSLEETAEGAA